MGAEVVATVEFASFAMTELQAAAKAKLANVEEREAELKVLQKLTESIDTATQSLNELRDEKLASMAVVGEIDADGPSATGSTEPAPMT